MDTLYKAFKEKKLVDLELILDDGSNKIHMNVHKVLLVVHIKYFEKLLMYNNEAIIVLHVANSYAAQDLILSIYGQSVNSGNLPKWHHLLNIAKCRDYFCLDTLKYDIPEEIDAADYDHILELCGIIGFDETNLRTLSDNLPPDYPLTKLSTSFAKEIIKNKISFMVTTKNDNKITLWDILTNEVINTFELKTKISKHEISGNNEYILLKNDEECNVYSIKNPSIKYSFGICRKYTFSTDTSTIAIVNSDGIGLFDLTKGFYIKNKTFVKPPLFIVFVPFSMKIIIVDAFLVKMWNIDTDNVIKVCDFECYKMSFSKDAKYVELIDGTNIDTGLRNRKIWDISTDNPIELFRESTIMDTSFKNHKSLFCPEAIDYVLFHVADQIEIYNIDTKNIIYKFDYDEYTCTFSDNNEYLLILKIEYDFYTQIINMKTGEKCFRLDTCDFYFISPNSKFLAGHDLNHISIWDLCTTKMLYNIDTEWTELEVMFSPNDRYLIINTNGADVSVYDMLNGKLVNKMQKSIDVFCLKPHYNDLCQRLLQQKIE